MNQLQVQDRYCANPDCHKLLEHTKMKDQKHCCTNCANIMSRKRQSEKAKLITAKKKYAQSVFRFWHDNQVPLNQLSYNHQLCIKVGILFNMLSPAQKMSVANKKWYIKNRKMKNNHKREYYFITVKQNFARFWDALEQ